ncbi:MAG: family 4 glycosyl hydrolase [Actinomycetota bacterium]
MLELHALGFDAEHAREPPLEADRDGAHPLGLAPLDDHMRALVQHVKSYERLTIAAAMNGDRTAALRALLTNPLVPGYTVASELLDVLLEANRSYLSRFFPAG